MLRFIVARGVGAWRTARLSAARLEAAYPFSEIKVLLPHWQSNM